MQSSCDSSHVLAMQLSEPGLYIAQIAVEMAPICKVGGLGDVVTALGRAVKEQGHHMEIILPRHAPQSTSMCTSSDVCPHTQPMPHGSTQLESDNLFARLCTTFIEASLDAGIVLVDDEPSACWINSPLLHNQSRAAA